MIDLPLLSKRTGFDDVTRGPRLLHSIHEVAELLDCGRTKAYEMVSSGQLPSVRIGRSVRVPASGLNAWIRDHTTGGRADQ